MTIILTGGGSGGHITPVLAVASELKKRGPNLELVYIGQKGDPFASIVGDNPNIDKLLLVRAGKFRRFHGEGIKQVFDIPVLLKNTRDFFYVGIGIVQSTWKIRKLKASVVFSRGGYVSVPVALGAKFNHVPYITHDSDPIPSLANRIIAPWAAVHAVALPKDIYPYPEDKTVTTGIPLNHQFVHVTSDLKAAYRKEIDMPAHAKMLFIIGGGLGSLTINNTVTNGAHDLLKQFEDLYIFHIAGASNEKALKRDYEAVLTEAEQGRVRVFGFIKDVYKYSGAADVVVSRAGATNLAEFAVQGKAVIVVPSSVLTGGHQVKNAQYLMEKEAALMVNEDKLEELIYKVVDLLQDKKEQELLAKNLSKFAINDAAEKIADIILGLGNGDEVKA